MWSCHKLATFGWDWGQHCGGKGPWNHLFHGSSSISATHILHQHCRRHRHALGPVFRDLITCQELNHKDQRQHSSSTGKCLRILRTNIFHFRRNPPALCKCLRTSLCTRPFGLDNLIGFTKRCRSKRHRHRHSDPGPGRGSLSQPIRSRHPHHKPS